MNIHNSTPEGLKRETAESSGSAAKSPQKGIESFMLSSSPRLLAGSDGASMPVAL